MRAPDPPDTSPPCSTREFHHTGDRLLNREAGDDSAWANLGYWRDGATYPQACAALADQLGNRLDLGPHQHVLDVGFGNGDPLLHWIHRYGVTRLTGLNLSRSQTELARQRLLARGLEQPDIQLHRGDASELPALAQTPGWRVPDVIIALDCAYHFNTREQFLRDAAALLPTGGHLGVSDLVLGRAPRSTLERLALRVMTRLARIPRANQVTLATYQQQWRQAGLQIEHCEDISAQVMAPFGEWLQRYRQGLSHDTGNGSRHRGPWLRYEVTAAFLKWADRRRLLRYVVCTARRV